MRNVQKIVAGTRISPGLWWPGCISIKNIAGRFGQEIKNKVWNTIISSHTIIYPQILAELLLE